MGTNYYLRSTSTICPTCKHNSKEDIHIGKSSAGWCFSLHVYPEDGINTLEDWEKRWQEGEIYNEYGEYIPVKRMENTIKNRSNERGWSDKDWYGYLSEEDFHRSNHSERGPNGMLRHKIGDYCVGHGEGTWDYIIGRFS